MRFAFRAALVAIFFLFFAQAANAMYSSKSDVVQVNNKNFKQQVMLSNHTSIVEFYAPWCGHCKNLKPDYEKVAASLKGVANVAAIDCDAAENKQLCSSMGVQAFPTLKIFRPGKKAGQPVIEDYRGQRKAKPIVDAILPKINNHVTMVADDSLDQFLTSDAQKPHALLFTDKGKTGPVLRAIAIDYLGVISVGQIRDKETEAVGKFGVDKFPTLLLFPDGEASTPIKYDGELKKDDVMQFLRQVAEPNKPAEKKPRAKKENKEKTEKVKMEKTETKEKAKVETKEKVKVETKEKAKAETKTRAETKTQAETKTKTETETETASTTEQQTAPVIVEGPLPVPTLHTPEKLIKSCLHKKAGICILAIVSGSDEDDTTKTALDGLANLKSKYAKGDRYLFPIYVVPDSNAVSADIVESLHLQNKSSGSITLVALSSRRGWWRPYSKGDDVSPAAIEDWIDSIRMSAGGLRKLPEAFLSTVTANFTDQADVKHEEL